MAAAREDHHKWQEFYENGQFWIDGEIALVPERLKRMVLTEGRVYNYKC